MEHVPDPVFTNAATLARARQRADETCEEIIAAAREQRDYMVALLPRPQHPDDLVAERVPRTDKALRYAHVTATQIKCKIIWAAESQEHDTLALLPYYSDYENALPKKQTSRLHVTPPVPEPDVGWKEENDMWTLSSEGLTAKPLNTFDASDVLRWLKKRRDLDWSALVPPDDAAVLRRYGFDTEGLRRVRNRFLKALRPKIEEALHGHGRATLEEIGAAMKQHLPPAISAQIDLEPLEKRFLGRWLLRMQRAKKEELYQTSAPHKRRLEELEDEVQQLREKRPRLFE